MRGPREIAHALFARQQRGIAPIVLVLDDYHTITNGSIHHGVDQLVVEAPSSLRLVISTRHDPPLMLAKLRAQGNLHEIRYHDLRLDAAEVAALLNEELGIGLGESDLSRLTERTEGWAAGVQLVGLTLQHHSDPSGFVDQFAGDDRHISDYLRDEVLSQLPERLRGFLLATAILDRLNAPLCRAVTGMDDAQDLLEQLDRLNLFVIPLDNRREWFRYHHLFAEWLRLQAHEDPLEQHRIAADWLAAHHQPGDAIRHYVSAGEADRGASLIDRERWVLVGQGREETLREWTQLLPPEVRRRHPQLTLAAAWVAHHAGRWDDLHSLVDSFQSEPLTSSIGDGALVQAEVALLESGRLIALGRSEEALQMAGVGLTLIPDDEPRARTGLLLVTGRCHMAFGDLGRAERAFRSARDLAAPYNVTIVEVIAGAHLAEIDRLEGRTAAAEANSRGVLDLAEHAGLSDNAECSVAHLTLGNVLLDLGRREEAEEEISRGSALATRMPYVARAQQASAANARLSQGVRRSPSPGLIEPISGRELSVLRLLPSSLTPREIAGELYLSLNTVKTHTRALYRKLGVQSRHAAIEEGRRLELI